MSEEFELEIEVIKSMYDNVIVIDPSSSPPSSSSSSSSCYRIIELTLIPRVLASSSFVEITIQIQVPWRYVSHSANGSSSSDDNNVNGADSFIPKVIIKRSSGLADEGRQLHYSIQKLHSTFLPGTIIIIIDHQSSSIIIIIIIIIR